VYYYALTPNDGIPREDENKAEERFLSTKPCVAKCTSGHENGNSSHQVLSIEDITRAKRAKHRRRKDFKSLSLSNWGKNPNDHHSRDAWAEDNAPRPRSKAARVCWPRQRGRLASRVLARGKPNVGGSPRAGEHAAPSRPSGSCRSEGSP